MQTAKARPASRARRWLPWSGGYKRYYHRYDCRLEAQVTLLVSRIDLTGLVLDISRRGCLFRPATQYLLQRADTPAAIRLGDMVLTATIMNTSTRGYGVVFADEIPAARLAALLGREDIRE